MNKLAFRISTVGAILIGFCLPALAECPSLDSLSLRAQRLESRIEQGKSRGVISQEEAKRLQSRLGKLCKEVRNCQAAHCMSNFEYQQISSDFDRLSARISRALVQRARVLN
jgi:hypothetical protein